MKELIPFILYAIGGIFFLAGLHRFLDQAEIMKYTTVGSLRIVTPETHSIIREPRPSPLVPLLLAILMFQVAIFILLIT